MKLLFIDETAAETTIFYAVFFLKMKDKNYTKKKI